MGATRSAAAGGRDADLDQALAYYDEVRRAFERTGSYAEYRLEVAGTSVSLRIAGSGLGPAFLPALAPLVRASADRPELGEASARAVESAGASDFEIEMWDAASTGVTIPQPPWRLRDVIARGDVRHLSNGRIRAQIDTGTETLTMWDGARRVGVMWADDAARLPYWARAAPLRSILHWGLAGATQHLLHAAAVGDQRAGALIAGPSGSGKSTTALACLEHGLGYIADDYVLAQTASRRLAQPSPRPEAVALYGTAKLDAMSMRLLPRLAAMNLAPDAPKSAVDIARERPELMRRSGAISAIVLPRVTDGPLRLAPVASAQALRALAPSTILQHGGESAGAMAVIAALVRRVPAYALDLGADIAAVGPAIASLLESRA